MWRNEKIGKSLDLDKAIKISRKQLITMRSSLKMAIDMINKS